MQQKPKHNTLRKKVSTYWSGEYVNFYTQKRHPISKTMVERMALDLATWAKDNAKAIKIAQFYAERGIPESTFMSLKKKFKVLADACGAAKVLIGNRRELGMMEKRYPEKSTMYRMYRYDPTWKEDEDWRNDLKIKAQQDNDGTKEITCIFKDYKPTDKKKNNIPEGE